MSEVLMENVWLLDEMLLEFEEELREIYGDSIFEEMWNNSKVDVLDESCDGYWTIRLGSGVVVDGICWNLLDGFSENSRLKL